MRENYVESTSNIGDTTDWLKSIIFLYFRRNEKKRQDIVFLYSFYISFVYKVKKTRSPKTTEAQLSKITKKSSTSLKTQLNVPRNHQKELSYKSLGSKTVKNVQIDLQTTKLWPKQLIVTLSVS